MIRDEHFAYVAKDRALDSFRDQVHSIVHHQGLSFGLLERRIGWPQSRLTALMNGTGRNNNPTVQTLAFVAEGLDMELILRLDHRNRQR